MDSINAKTSANSSQTNMKSFGAACEKFAGVDVWINSTKLKFINILHCTWLRRSCITNNSLVSSRRTTPVI